MAVLAYIGILFLIPLLAAKESPFARFHTNQGIILCITGIIVGVALNILSVLSFAISPALLVITGILSLIGSIGLFVLMIIGIVHAVKGEAEELPVIGKYKILK